LGLVVGLAGTGDGGKYASTMRALMALHKRYEQPILDINELKANANIALVTVEVTIPEFGAREGQTLDVIVSSPGTAKSLAGGQLLTTPLQDATLTVPDILALASGRIELPDPKSPTRGLIRGGAVLEQDFFYNFIEDERITLVLDDVSAGFPMAQMIARAINHEVAPPADPRGDPRGGQVVVRSDMAVALGPKNVRVRIPPYELAQPANFISRVLQTPLFLMPEQPARVVVNRATKSVSITGNVTVSPTVLQIAGLGSVTIGAGGNLGGAAAPPEGAGLKPAKPGEAPPAAAPAPVGGGEGEARPGAQFQELMDTFARVKLTPQQIVEAIEQLHRTGTLHAQLIYTE
jgi:flagellar P-ring protein FlgI